MDALLKKIRGCTLCAPELPLGPRPVLAGSPASRIVIIGQAPGTKVHASGIPWDDASGRTLRKWLDISDETFYDADQVCILPMGFCYPGKGKSGDLPPRKECAPEWHAKVLAKMPKVDLVLLIGQYAQQYYLGGAMARNLTETVRNYEEYLPQYFVLPHPSPRNRFWLSKNPWFEEMIIPELQARVATALLQASQ